MTERHIMLDLETMGTAPGSALLSIGAVHFDPRGAELPALEAMDFRHRFYRTVSLESCQRAGLTIDAGTVEWWLKQSAEARAGLTEETPADIGLVLIALSGWAMNLCGVDDKPVIWGHGAGFDPVLLEAAYRACRTKPFWTYKDIRDTRTLFDLVRKPHIGNDHHALRDAWAQARAVQQAMARISVVP